METLIKDVQYGIRNLVKRPGLTSIIVITLALGIGATTAIGNRQLAIAKWG